MRTSASDRPRRLYAPLAPAALGFAVGVVVDRFGVSFSTANWAAAAIMAGLVASIRSHVVLIFAAFAMLGGARHHQHWSDLAPDDLARSSWSTPRPSWIKGAIVAGPELWPGAVPGEEGFTKFTLDTSAISDGVRWHAASGRINVFVDGDRTDLRPGSAIFAAGNLGEIPGPLNPGEADRRERARADGVRLRLSVNDGESVWPDPEGRPNLLAGWLGHVRERSRKLLSSSLDPDVSALAEALLLGRREVIDPDLNDAFARTGTTHLLAISGLHLQALSWVLFVAFTALGARPKIAYIAVVVATLFYASLVGWTPSVARSSTMTVALCLASLCDRCAMPANRLAVAALATLLWTPSALFDAGCQLSFLAIMALFWGVAWLMPRTSKMDPDDHETPKARLDALERKLEPRWKIAMRGASRWVVVSLVASMLIWTAAIPLVALRFHTIAPIGVVLNLPLIPITSLALFLAGASLGAATVWTPLAVPSSWACAGLLRSTMGIVRWGEAIPWGWSFTPGPSLAGTLGFYALLGLASWASFQRHPAHRWIWAALAVESCAMIAMVLCPSRPKAPEVDILAVGHGLAVIVQGTDGGVILYDCGAMRDPHIGRRVIAPALWSRGVSRIETVVLSHADSDHYDGLPDLLDRFAIGAVRIPPGFGGASNPEAERLLARVRARGVPILDIAAGSLIAMVGGRVKVLHPDRGWGLGTPDNARSVVLDVAGPGGSILLTGDLEGTGLEEMTATDRTEATSMLAPHHGARAANPDWLFRWAGASRVIASQRRPGFAHRADPLSPLVDRGITVDRTWEVGAVRLSLGRDDHRKVTTRSDSTASP